MYEDEEIDLMNKAGYSSSIEQQAQQNALNKAIVEEQERTLAESQLEVDIILEEIYHLLKQDVYIPTKEGKMEWRELKDESQRILTDQGVERIMQLMKFYINKNNLLSNFDSDTIKRRMLEFCLALNANIFMKYEVYFREPSLEECKEILKDRIMQRTKIKVFAKEIFGLKADEKQIEKEIIKETENRIEMELDKIRQEVRKRNLKEYELVFIQLKSIVEATHNRAFHGEERGSLRRHMNVSEILGGYPRNVPKEQGGISKWIRGG